ncbi:hypothetical protein RJ639_016418 [Escallonia herrerae]|uniref:DNA-(apurinic or apyrimidinic site) endonuclease 2 n=1 Tax=Escallonia herrerae TaxID=1293975 RepID=A0AA88VDJ2_9ASTE|nr:hypothetical protein RJ639_016418 [Escallonia herrerae]
MNEDCDLQRQQSEEPHFTVRFPPTITPFLGCRYHLLSAKQELRADVVWADGFESFFSCTRTVDRGRTGYSGVATFCRVKSAFSSNEVALPVDAEEGFTGLLENARGFGTRKDEFPNVAEGLEEFSREVLLKVDSEGRCIITDHGHFVSKLAVLFNIYGPRAECDDTERIQFKHTFFKILQRRWESLLHRGRRILVVGDLNIAPAAIDRCDAGSDFEKNEFRKWFRSLLVENGGSFFDVFRAKHPERREAYTCWPTNTGAEEFNFGTRIDHILIAGSCLHEVHNLEGHDFVTCHVAECNILTQFKRWKPGNTPRWKGGRSIKLEGSDHAPVCISLFEIPNIPQHSTPSFSTRYCPQVEGCQQTLVSMLMRRQSAAKVNTTGGSSSSDEKVVVQSCNQSVKSSVEAYKLSGKSLDQPRPTEDSASVTDECSQASFHDVSNKMLLNLGNNNTKQMRCVYPNKKARHSQSSQLSLTSFFQKTSKCTGGDHSSDAVISLNQADLSSSNHYSGIASMNDDESVILEKSDLNICASSQNLVEFDACQSSEKEKRSVALLEWQRIQQHMQSSIPLCKGHGESCVSRIVKKEGPNSGRRFYVCARAEGPASNPEANCGYFKWADLRSKRKGRQFSLLVPAVLNMKHFGKQADLGYADLVLGREVDLVSLSKRQLVEDAKLALDKQDLNCLAPIVFDIKHLVGNLDSCLVKQASRALSFLLDSPPSPPPLAQPPLEVHHGYSEERTLYISLGVLVKVALISFLLNSLFCCSRRQSPNGVARAVASNDTQVTAYDSSAPSPLSSASSRLVESESCSICLAEFERGELLRVLPRCKHMFHKDCIDQWLPSRSLHCPVCRDCAIERDVKSGESCSSNTGTPAANSSDLLVLTFASTVHMPAHL